MSSVRFQRDGETIVNSSENPESWEGSIRCARTIQTPRRQSQHLFRCSHTDLYFIALAVLFVIRMMRPQET